MLHTAGAGLPLLQVYDAIFGTSKAAKAFRSVVKKINKDGTPKEAFGDQFPLAAQVVRIMADSQEFKTFLNQTDIGTAGIFKHAKDPYQFMVSIGWYLPDLKKSMEVELNRAAPKLMAATKKFLLEWANTNVRRVYPPTKEMVLDLAPFRPISRTVIFRGIQFANVGELVAFTQKYGSGKSFPFKSNRYSSWTKSVNIAERFAKYHANTSQFGGMMSWLSRSQVKKDYDGTGGYVVGAWVQPKDCLVDLTHPALPFEGGQHGDEQEVIVLPNTELVCKVYKVFGDVLREVEEFQKGKYNGYGGTPSSKSFYIFGYKSKIEGDSESGTIEFISENPVKYTNARKDSQTGYSGISHALTRNLYDFEWLNDNMIAYKRMKLPSRVATRYLYQ